MVGENENVACSNVRRVEEVTPLLDANRTSTTLPAKSYRRRVTLVTFVVISLMQLGASFLSPGLTVVLEQKICYDNDASLEAFDRDCKTPGIQGKLATIRGWQMTMDCIPGELKPSDFYHLHRDSTFPWLSLLFA
jgi:hypothetical protein